MAIKKIRFSPYTVNPLPSQAAAISREWRRQHASLVETEIVKPESFLPVTTGSTGRSPICFTLKSVPHSRIDGGNIFIETVFEIEKYDKTNSKWVPTDRKTDTVTPIANTYCSFFEDLNVSINGVLVENTQRDFTIKSYLQNLLFSTQSDRDTWLETGMLALDSPSKFRSAVKFEGDAEGLLFEAHRGNYCRRVLSDGTKKHAAYGKLMSDVLSCNEPLPDNVDINIKLFPAKSEACLVQDELSVTKIDYRIKITDCALYVPRITVKGNHSSDHHFGYASWRTLAYTHQNGQSNFKKDIAIGDTLPQKAMVVFMSEKAYNGTWDTNKLEFVQANTVNVLMKCNQRHLPFMNGYQCDWNNGIYHTAYLGLISELGAFTHPIRHENFDDGFTIYGFDLTSNKTGTTSMEAKTRGALELDVEFNPAPKENMMVIVLLIYADRFKITKSGAFIQE